MQAVLLAGRLLLAAVFLVAAIAKLLDLPGSRRSLEQLGIPAGLVPAGAKALPVVELAIAVALVPLATAWVAAVAASVLLLAFTVGVAVALARGVEADCHCFGRVASRPIGPATLIRNLGLLAVAIYVAVAGTDDAGTSATGWIDELSTGEAVAVTGGALIALALAFNTAFLFQLFRQNGRLWKEVEELRATLAGRSHEVQLGDYMPAFELPDLTGRVYALEDLLDHGDGLLLFFSDPGCSACEPVLPEIARRQRDPSEGPRPVVMTLGDADANRAKASEHGLDLVLLQDDMELARSVGVNGFPGALLLDDEGRVASEPAVGGHRVGDLLGITYGGPVEVVQVEAIG